MRRPLIVGNWKMHGTVTEGAARARAVRKGLKLARGAEIALAPPFTALAAVGAVIRRSPIRLAAQNVHWEDAGAFTGEVSARMLRDLGCNLVIIGHSERRRLFCETDRTIAQKIMPSLRARLRPILCVGETQQERQRGVTQRVLARQLRAALKEVTKGGIRNIDIAYEPLWAIGTGRNAAPDQVTQAHRWIRRTLGQIFGKKAAIEVRILYGGSVRPDNAAELARTPEVGGLLVGGVSLKAKEFLQVIRYFVAHRGVP